MANSDLKVDPKFWDERKEKFKKLVNANQIELAYKYFLLEFMEGYFRTFPSKLKELPKVIELLFSKLKELGKEEYAYLLIARYLYFLVDLAEVGNTQLLSTAKSEEQKYLGKDVRKIASVLKHKSQVDESVDREAVWQFTYYYKLYEAIAYLKAGEVDKAEKIMSALQSKLKDDPRVIYYKALVLFYKDLEGRRQEIIDLLNQVTQLSIVNKEYWLRSRAQILLGELATTAANKITYYDDVYPVMLHMGLYRDLAYFLVEKYIPVMQQDPSISPSDRLDMKVLAAETFKVINEIDKAIEVYRDIVKELLAREDYNTLVIKFSRLKILDNLPTPELKREFESYLETAYEKMLALNPTNISVLSGYAELLESMGKKDKAKEVYLKLGMVAIKEYEYIERAEEAFQKVLQIDPLELKAVYNLVDIWVRKGDKDSEIGMLILRTVNALREAGRQAEAESLAEKYKKYLPSEEQREFERRKLFKLLDSGDTVNFLASAENYLKLFPNDKEVTNSYLRVASENFDPDTPRFNFALFTSLLLRADSKLKSSVLSTILARLVDQKAWHALKDTFLKFLDMNLEPDTLKSIEPYARVLFHINPTDTQLLSILESFYSQLEDKVLSKLGLLAIANTFKLIDTKRALRTYALLKELNPKDINVLLSELEILKELKDRTELIKAVEQSMKLLKDSPELLKSILSKVLFELDLSFPEIINYYLDVLDSLNYPEEELVHLVEHLYESKRYDLIKEIASRLEGRKELPLTLKEKLIDIYTLEHNLESLLNLALNSIYQSTMGREWLTALGKFIEVFEPEKDLSRKTLNSLLAIFKTLQEREQEVECKEKAVDILKTLFDRLSTISSAISEDLKPTLLDLAKLYLEFELASGHSQLEDSFKKLFSKLPSGDKINLLLYLLNKDGQLTISLYSELELEERIKVLELETTRESPRFPELLEATLKDFEPSSLPQEKCRRLFRLLVLRWAEISAQKAWNLLLDNLEYLTSGDIRDLITKLETIKFDFQHLKDVLFRLSQKDIDLVDVMIRKYHEAKLFDEVERDKLLSLGLKYKSFELIELAISKDGRLSLNVIKELVEESSEEDVNTMILAGVLGLWDEALNRLLKLTANLQGDLKAKANLYRLVAKSFKVAGLYDIAVPLYQEILEMGIPEPKFLNKVKFELAKIYEHVDRQKAMEIYSDLYLEAPELKAEISKSLEALGISAV